MSSKYEKDSLGTRMKRYESVTRTFLTPRTPVIIRIDGKTFHTFTKRITPENDKSLENGPFSHKLHWIMTRTMEQLVNKIQNAKIGYTQSDEISILLTDWDKLTTDQWFGGTIQKITSVSASIATAYFNHYYAYEFHNGYTYLNTLAQFDSRVFNIPKEEVANYFIWRQQDATRNSIQMLGQHHFGSKLMHGKNGSQIQDMLMLDKNTNWNDLATWKKRGSCYTIHSTQIDEEIPIFTQNRDYIENFVYSTEK